MYQKSLESISLDHLQGFLLEFRQLHSDDDSAFHDAWSRGERQNIGSREEVDAREFIL